MVKKCILIGFEQVAGSVVFLGNELHVVALPWNPNRLQ
jgi:hypothetical protein